MVEPQITKRGSGAAPLVRAISSPALVLSVIVTFVAIAALFHPGPWVPALGLIWLVTTVLVAGALLLAAPPLRPLRERSHLIGRLQWLLKFTISAGLFCLSAFVGAIAGTQVRVDASGLHLDGLQGLMGSLLNIALGVGMFLFLMWLASDIWRLGSSGRLAAIERGMRFVARPWVLPPLSRPLARWLLALTSPAWLTLALVVSAFWTASVLFHQGGLRIG